MSTLLSRRRRGHPTVGLTLTLLATVILSGATCQRNASTAGTSGATAAATKASSASSAVANNQATGSVSAARVAGAALPRLRAPIGFASTWVLPERPVCARQAAASLDVSVIDDEGLEEVSGIAASSVNEGLVWMVADRGNEPIVSGVDAASGVTRLQVTLPHENVDFEDLALGPCPDLSGPCVYVADTGDNDLERSSVVVYAFPEPTLGKDSSRWSFSDPEGKRMARVSLEATWILPLVFPDDEAVNVEAMAIFPNATGMLFIEKTTDPVARVFAYPAPWTIYTPQDGDDTNDGPRTLVAAGTFTVPPLQKVSGRGDDKDVDDGDDEKARRVTGAEVHWSGTRMLIRTTGALFQFFADNPDAFFNPDALAPPEQWAGLGGELQGEAVTWDEDGLGILSISEKKKGQLPTLHRLVCEMAQR